MKRLLLLWLAILATLTSCGKTDSPAPPPVPIQEEKSERGYQQTSKTEEIKMGADVINVKKDINQFLVKASPESNRLEYKYNEILDQIKEGDVLYSSGQHSLEEAYSVKVKKIIREGSRLIIETEPASVSDVFKEFKQKSEFVFNPNGNTEFFDVEAQLNDPTLGEVTNSEASTLRSLELKRIPKDKSKDRGNISFKDGDATISYPLFDKDGNYATKNDQFLLKLKVKRRENPFHSITYSLKDAYFAMIGQMEFEYHIDLTYGFEFKKDATIDITDDLGQKIGITDESSFKSWLNERTIYLMKSKANKKVDPDLAKTLGKIGKKKILLASLPLKLKSPSDLLVEPRLYVFVEMSYSFDGKLWVHFEYKPVIIDYHIELSALTQNVFKVGLSSIRPPSFQNFEINGRLQGEAKAGVKAMLSLDFLPAIRKEGEVTAANYIGLYGELYTKAKVSAEAKISKENISWSGSTLSNDDWTGHFLADLNLGAYFSSGLEVRANLFDYNFEYDKEFTDPISILPTNLHLKSGFIKLDGGTTYKLKDEEGGPAFWAIKTNKVSSSSPEVATAVYDEAKKQMIIHGQSVGQTWLTAEFPKGQWKWAWLRINVSKSKSQVNGNVDISKGEQL